MCGPVAPHTARGRARRVAGRGARAAPGAGRPPVPRVATRERETETAEIEIDVRACTCPGGGACTWPVAPDVLAFCLRSSVASFDFSLIASKSITGAPAG